MNQLPITEYMKGMHLRTWIFTLLDAKAVYGLEYVRNDPQEISFRFPWAKLGDQDWEKKWGLLFKYAEHKGISLPPKSNSEERKKELGKLKNKFRNAMNKSRDFELQHNTRAYYQYRIVTESHPKAPTSTFQCKAVQPQEVQPPTSDVTHQLFPLPLSSQVSGSSVCRSFPRSPPPEKRMRPSEEAVTNHQSSCSGRASYTEMLNEDINLQQEVVTTMVCEEDIVAGQQQMDFQQHKPQYTTLQPAVSTGATLETPSQQHPVPINSTNITQDASAGTAQGAPSQKLAPNPPEDVYRFTDSQVSPKANNPHDVAQSKSSPGPNNPVRQVLEKFNITDDDLSVFDIRIQIGQQVIHESRNLKNGLQIIFTPDCNNVLKQYDYAVGDLLDEIGQQTRYKYRGNDPNIKTILDCSNGGIILKYQGKSLYVYRLCQTRVFVQSPYQQTKRKLERCSLVAGITMLNTFSYSKLISELQKSPDPEGDDWTNITFGSDIISVKVYPRCAGKLRELLKVPKMEEGQTLTDFKSTPFSFEDKLNCTTASMKTASIDDKK